MRTGGLSRVELLKQGLRTQLSEDLSRLRRRFAGLWPLGPERADRGQLDTAESARPHAKAMSTSSDEIARSGAPTASS